MQNQPDKPQSVERKRVSKFSDSVIRIFLIKIL